MRRRFYISLSYATYAIVSVNGIITDCAPIANWMRGKSLIDIKPFLLQKKAIVKEIFL